MKLSMKEFFQKCQMPLLLVFATAPVCLFLYGYLVPGLLHLCWITPAWEAPSASVKSHPTGTA